MAVPNDRVDVVLEIEELPEGHRVHYLGVYPEGGPYPEMKYNYRNVIQSWFAIEHDVRAFLLYKED